jgi:hypothetical protein
VLGAAPLHAEALSPPPVPIDPWAQEQVAGDEQRGNAAASSDERSSTIPTGFFPAVHAWLGLERYSYNTGHPRFAYDFDLGAHMLLYGGRRATLSGLGRLLYQNRGVEGMRFGIDPTAILTDLHLRLRIRELPVTPTLWYRHDCKHDIATAPRRDVIHDALGISIEDRRRWSGGYRFTYRLTAEYDLPLIFQNYQANANVASFHLALRPELLIGTAGAIAGATDARRLHASSAVVFAELRGSLLIDDPVSDFATAGRTRMDWLARAGLSWPDASRGATLYAQVERITDPWRLSVSESQAATLLSVGLMLGGTGTARRPHQHPK